MNDPAYVPTSYNKTLSINLENHLGTAQNRFLLDTYIKVYDKITNDSLKYIVAIFDMSQDYIDNTSFDSIKNEIFRSMFEIIPKQKFILKGKFIYNGNSTIKSTESTYDWRKMKDS